MMMVSWIAFVLEDVDYFVSIMMCATVLFILGCFPVIILEVKNYIVLILLLLSASSADIDDNIIDSNKNNDGDCCDDDNDEQHINNYGSFSKIGESLNKKERIELLQEDKLLPRLKPAISSSTSSSSPQSPPLKLKSATTRTAGIDEKKKDGYNNNINKFRVSFDNSRNDDGNDDDGDNSSILSALTMRENFTMSTTTSTNNNSNSRKKKKKNPILKKFRTLWKATTNNTIRRKKKNNNNDDDDDDEGEEVNGDNYADADTTTISVSPLNNSNINSNNNGNNRLSSCLILLMEPTSRTFEIMTIQYSPGISTVSNILEEIPLQSTFNFRLRFTNYIGLLGVGMTIVTTETTTTTTTNKKKTNEEIKEADVTTITNCSHVHQLLQSKPVSKQYSCEYQYQQQKQLLEEKQHQKEKEEAKKHFMMVLVAILPDKCSNKNSTITSDNTADNNSGNSNSSDNDSNSMIETTKRMACQLMTNPKIGLRLQYLQKQMVDNNKESSSPSPSGGVIDEKKEDI
jgi:hypothetical protein